MQDKTELRKTAKTKRKLLDIKKISEQIVLQTTNSKFFQNSTNIMLFYPLDFEINLLGLLDNEKNFYLPKVKGENLLICPYKKGDILIESKFKTLEPKSDDVSPEILDLIFLPALAVDKEFYRLGYGGGFYDRFLSQKTIKAIKATAISQELLLDKIPHESFDIQSDIIITETSLIERLK